MRDDDILKVARECGANQCEQGHSVVKSELITFARRIAAMQREEILSQELLFCCQDPMGQDALNTLEQYIRSQSDE